MTQNIYMQAKYVHDYLYVKYHINNSSILLISLYKLSYTLSQLLLQLLYWVYSSLYDYVTYEYITGHSMAYFYTYIFRLIWCPASI
jgi:hypothetical protein